MADGSDFEIKTLQCYCGHVKSVSGNPSKHVHVFARRRFNP